MPKFKHNLKLSFPGIRDEEKTSIVFMDPDVERNKKRKKRKACLKPVVSYVKEYCGRSTLHGLQYIGEEKRPFAEKIFWVTIIIFSLYLCYILIFNIWKKWDETPVIVSFSEKSTPVWQIPFPAITICAETKYEKQSFPFPALYGSMWANMRDNNTVEKGHEGMTQEEFKRMRALFQVCEWYVIENIFFDMYETIDIIKNVEELAPSFNKTFPFCKWKNNFGNCDDIFSKTITEEGICYTFNGLNSSELYREDSVNYYQTTEPKRKKVLQWNLQDGYSSDAGTETYPERVLGAGARPGIFFALQGFDYNTDVLCRGPIQGFKVLLHSPDDIPQLSRQYFRVPFGKEILISVKPNMITTSESLDDYLPHRRQCYFSDERYLRFFKVYTQNNCELECLANFTLLNCGCVKFSMPRTPDMPVCDVADIQCYLDAEYNLLRNEFAEGLVGSGENVRGVTKCDCLPSCTSLAYNAEISQADFDLVSILEAFNETYHYDNPGVIMARLSVFFKENQFITSKRSELYGMTDFLANCGGLLGLFMGFSLLSLIELLYFCSIRLFSNLLMKREKKKDGKKNEINLVSQTYINTR